MSFFSLRPKLTFGTSGEGMLLARLPSQESSDTARSAFSGPLGLLHTFKLLQALAIVGRPAADHLLPVDGTWEWKQSKQQLETIAMRGPLLAVRHDALLHVLGAIGVRELDAGRPLAGLDQVYQRWRKMRKYGDGSLVPKTLQPGCTTRHTFQHAL